MKIISGKYRGLKLKTPKNKHLRPTSGRVRESIFNILFHGLAGFQMQTVNVIDLFCGTGALGIEALSRGANHAVFVDESSQAIEILKSNISLIEKSKNNTILKIDAMSIANIVGLGKDSFGLAFLDPPYNKGLTSPSLIALNQSQLLKSGAFVVVELSKSEKLQIPDEYKLLMRRDFGLTSILFLAYAYSS